MIIVAVSLAFGIIPVVAPEFYNAFPSWVGIILHSGISSATIMQSCSTSSSTTSA